MDLLEFERGVLVWYFFYFGSRRMALTVISALVSLVDPSQLESARRVTRALFPPGDAYTTRLRIGRVAQLGADDEAPLVYRPGLIDTGSSAQAVESALTYGEYDVDFFAALVDAALTAGGRNAHGATLIDVGSGCGRLVTAAYPPP